MASFLNFLALDLKGIIIIVVIAILVLALLGIIISNRKYKVRYNRFYKKFDKTINKKYNGNMLIEDLINKYTVDGTNTFKSLKRKGKNITKKYLEYYQKNLPEQVLLKSFTSPDKNRSELIIIVLDDNDRVLYKWDKSKKIKGFIKVINKYQMLTPLIAFLYELPLNINENKDYRLINHDNDNVITYEIVKNIKKVPKKYKNKKVVKDKQGKKKKKK
ncbi:MAG: hypothetical protein CVV60_01240 [Tenericutes bacterium HGW-Tenericutes-5]|jgi:hypothetical protein|nr:MAG: hypothetical protein CVV60_01240 [Tenericutes bacterium HGW-Tenericutes-5]